MLSATDTRTQAHVDARTGNLRPRPVWSPAQRSRVAPQPFSAIRAAIAFDTDVRRCSTKAGKSLASRD